MNLSLFTTLFLIFAISSALFWHFSGRTNRGLMIMILALLTIIIIGSGCTVPPPETPTPEPYPAPEQRILTLQTLDQKVPMPIQQSQYKGCDWDGKSDKAALACGGCRLFQPRSAGDVLCYQDGYKYITWHVWADPDEPRGTHVPYIWGPQYFEILPPYYTGQVFAFNEPTRHDQLNVSAEELADLSIELKSTLPFAELIGPCWAPTPALWTTNPYMGDYIQALADRGVKPDDIWSQSCLHIYHVGATRDMNVDQMVTRFEQKYLNPAGLDHHQIYVNETGYDNHRPDSHQVICEMIEDMDNHPRIEEWYWFAPRFKEYEPWSMLLQDWQTPTLSGDIVRNYPEACQSVQIKSQGDPPKAYP